MYLTMYLTARDFHTLQSIRMSRYVHYTDRTLGEIQLCEQHNLFRTERSVS